MKQDFNNNKLHKQLLVFQTVQETYMRKSKNLRFPVIVSYKEVLFAVNCISLRKVKKKIDLLINFIMVKSAGL